MNVPEAIVRRIYVSGSMSNSRSGLVFRLKNTLVSGHLTAAGAMEVDGRSVSQSAIVLRTRSAEVRASEVSAESPLGLPAGIELEVNAEGVVLDPGRHQVRFPVVLKEIGPVTLTVADEIQ
ncbi:MAG: hypothetical protein ACOYES_05475 [Bacillota bacterium]|jgi:hypothetical protein